MARSKKDTSVPPTSTGREGEQLLSLSGMYQNYFLDYASYVILERAVPAVEDGLKPVQRRILHAMYEQHDGRYHKVANLIGQTMQYHPHGDAAIGEALVNLGQRDLLIDCQGNWGDYRTGDPAAAPRYIEARLTKFALEVAFNPKTTRWQMSYDGRKREPVVLPMKFPLLLAQGVEGIAVGLSTRVLPHNFIELCEASIAALKGQEVNLYPDFPTGGLVDVGQYNGGARGGRVRVRARIQEIDKKTLRITELPYGVFVGDLIESILKANEKGQIKVKRVTDKTAAEVDIEIELQPGVSPDVTIDALYAFTDCEISISPNCCVIQGQRPLFTDVNELLRISTENTKDLLRQELEIERRELEEQLHFASLEKIFIEKRIYRDIEECETWEDVLLTIEAGLRRYVLTPDDPAYVQPATDKTRLLRALTTDDLVRLTEIRIKRISKYNTFKADEEIAHLQEQLRQTIHHLEHLTEYAIAYFRRLIEKYGAGRERRTEIAVFDDIRAAEVVANNAKLYVDRAGGFIGFGLKKDEFVQDCSDIDDVIVFRRDGTMKVVRIGEKVFVGKDIVHVAVWKKGDERTTYNMVYLDGKTGRTMVKRFNVTAITRDKEYAVGGTAKGSRILYLTANPNGESEVVTVTLSPNCSAKLKVFDYDFGELGIKGRDAQGNILTKYPVKSIRQKEVGKSTIGAQKIWYDDITGRLNTQERGRLLGEFDTGDQLLVLYRDGSYELTDTDLLQRLEPKEVLEVSKFSPDLVVSAVHFEGHKGWTMVKRFHIETTRLRERYSYISNHPKSKLLFASTKSNAHIRYSLKVKGKVLSGEIRLGDFVDVKGWKAMGNKLSDTLLSDIQEINGAALPADDVPSAEPLARQTSLFEAPAEASPSAHREKKTYKAGDTLEFD